MVGDQQQDVGGLLFQFQNHQFFVKHLFCEKKSCQQLSMRGEEW